MNNKSNHWASDPERVDAFLLKQFSETEIETLSMHLKECDECRSIVQQESELISGIKIFGRNQMKHRLRQKINTGKEKRFEWTQVASIAAAIIIIFGIVFTVRWFTDIERNNFRSREIVLEDQDVSHRSLWITGKIIAKNREFHGTLSANRTNFTIEKDSFKQIINIRQSKYAELPSRLKSMDKNSLQALFEPTPDGINLTLFTDLDRTPPLIGIEAPTTDSLIVYFDGQQIAYHIPGGWAGKI